MYHDHFEGWQRPKRVRPLFAIAMVALAGAPFAVEYAKPDLYPNSKGPWAMISESFGGDQTEAPSQVEASLGQIPEIEETVEQMAQAMGGEISPEMADSIRLMQAEQLMDPAANKTLDSIERVKRLYNTLHPKEISIPSSIPDLERIVTVADALKPEHRTGDLIESPVMRYALGEDGISPEMESAFRTVKKAKEGELVGMSEEQVAALARQRIGYVPSGIAPEEVAAPTKQASAVDRSIVEGTASVISAHQIMIGETMIRLEGVRSPSYDEICTNASGKEYDCVSWSMEGIKYVIGEKPVTCAVTELEHEEGGKIGRCRVEQSGAEVDLAKIAVRAGILIAAEQVENQSPSAYLSDMELAKNNKSGLWSGQVADRNPVETTEKGTQF